jgi:outer membrane biosynthesis protein TonB
MKMNCKIAAGALAAVVCAIWGAAIPAKPGATADDAALTAALCPVVYQVDQSPSERGFHYLFYGNAFFINEQGYLLTAAHVLSQLRGGQPYILVHPPAGPPRIIQASLVAADRDHDVAILRATPNPFAENYKVGFLQLEQEWVERGSPVLAASVHPSKPLDAYTLEASIEDRTSGQVFAFPFSQLEKGRSETELFLFNRQVRRGQSGAPVVSPDSGAVVGLVEGEWLRSSLMPLATTAGNDTPGTGAAVPIHYAIALLQQKGIAWHTPSGAFGPTENAARDTEGFSPPAPLSLVASPFPSQALFGGEVVFDALIDNHGRLTQLKVVRGESPFLDKVFSAVRTWSFIPARQDGRAVPARVGIVFQFWQSYDPPRKAAAHKYDEPLPNAPQRGALPVVTMEPQFPAPSAEDGSVILNLRIGRDGQVRSIRVLRDAESLAPAAKAAVQMWSFVPGKREGAAADSAAIVVVAFRHAANSPSAPRSN